MLKPRQRAARALLWTVHAGRKRLPPAPPGDAVAVAVAKGVPRAFYAAIGFRVFGTRALRLDAVEKIATRAHRLAQAGPFVPGTDLAALAGDDGEGIGAVLGGLGFRAEAPDAQGLVCYAAPGRQRGKGARGAKRSKRPPPRRPAGDPDSPFAKLAGLRLTP